MVEEKVIDASDGQNSGNYFGGDKKVPQVLSQIDVKADEDRLDTGIYELNRVLGGGMVPGSLTLVSGEPGIGKSTIILQSAANIAKKYGKILYVSGEESAEQIKSRADRVYGKISENFIQGSHRSSSTSPPWSPFTMPPDARATTRAIEDRKSVV